jgi:hypothetical protein
MLLEVFRLRMRSLFQSRVTEEDSPYPMVIRAAKPNLIGASLTGGCRLARKQVAG